MDLNFGRTNIGAIAVDDLPIEPRISLKGRHLYDGGRGGAFGAQRADESKLAAVFSLDARGCAKISLEQRLHRCQIIRKQSCNIEIHRLLEVADVGFRVDRTELACN